MHMLLTVWVGGVSFALGRPRTLLGCRSSSYRMGNLCTQIVMGENGCGVINVQNSTTTTVSHKNPCMSLLGHGIAHLMDVGNRVSFVTQYPPPCPPPKRATKRATYRTFVPSDGTNKTLRKGTQGQNEDEGGGGGPWLLS